MDNDVVLWIVVATALAFDFTNGFHDTANAVATSISTRAMSPRVAVSLAAVLNFVGAFLSLAVAATIAKGIVQADLITPAIVFAGLVGAIAWNLLTWYYGLPSSSSHALIGGLFGATLIAAGTGAFKVEGIVSKVVIPMFSSPLIGFGVAFVLMLALYWIFRGVKRRPASGVFRRLQVLSAGYMAFSHGTNDAQKTMGIITLALFSAGLIPDIQVPTWVVIVAATALSAGTAGGGGGPEPALGPPRA